MLMVLFVVVFLMMWLIILCYVLMARYYRKKRERCKEVIKTKYLRIIASYLSGKDDAALPKFPGLGNKFNRKILMNQLYDLSESLIGRQGERLNALYNLPQLQMLLKKGMNMRSSAARIKYLRLYSVVPLTYDHYRCVQKYLDSPDPQLRLAAQLAILNYNPRLIGDILRSCSCHLTTWDQMHLFDMMIRRTSEPVDYYDFIHEENPTVVVFALRMIRFLYLKNEKEHEIVTLLGHSNDQVRYEALKTASDLNIEKVDKLLLAYLSEISEKYKRLIIEFLVSNKLISSEELLAFFRRENTPVCKFYILQTIQNRYPTGEELIRELSLQTNDGEERSMCLHLLEKTL
jgi:hypothetical protein